MLRKSAHSADRADLGSFQSSSTRTATASSKGRDRRDRRDRRSHSLRLGGWGHFLGVSGARFRLRSASQIAPPAQAPARFLSPAEEKVELGKPLWEELSEKVPRGAHDGTMYRYVQNRTIPVAAGELRTFITQHPTFLHIAACKVCARDANCKETCCQIRWRALVCCKTKSFITGWGGWDAKREIGIYIYRGGMAMGSEVQPAP